MRRRDALALLLIGLAAPAGAEERRPDNAEWQRQLDAWQARQREKEAADRFWNGPREQRRNLTRDQIERWEYQHWRRRGWRDYPY
jgi:hypothetical protein